MKENDVKVDYDPHQLILYVEKEDGSYGPMKTGSYITKNYIDDYWLKRKNLEQQYMQKVQDGEISPIAYYMIIEELTISELSSRANIPKRRVKKHQDPGDFKKATLEELEKYSNVFDVPITNLFQAIVTNKKDLKIKMERTNNPLFVVLKIQE